MQITKIQKNHWSTMKKIYLEAFPPKERKPFFMLKHRYDKGKSEIWIAEEHREMLGFAVMVPCYDTLMLKYLAVSGMARGKGIGGQILRKISKTYPEKKIVLLIERINENAKNYHQRVKRKQFYLKNDFQASGLFCEENGEEMEILCKNGGIAPEEFIKLQKHTLGRVLFALSGTKIKNP